jgi:hypothetical protein
MPCNLGLAFRLVGYPCGVPGVALLNRVGIGLIKTVL